MAYSIDRMPERISIGRETETGVTDVMIDCGAWVDKWPGMALHAIHTPDGGAPYILQTETDGGVLVWHVTDADTATPGTGLVEIVGETDGRRKVSAKVKVSVAARMSGTVGEPPEAAKPWADRVVEAAERITGMNAQAKTLDAGIGATAEWDGQQGLLTIGVPKGDQGPKGEKGEKGPQGEKGEPGKDAVVDATLTQSGQAADAKVTGEAMACKLTEPSDGLAVGKYFRIAAIDESGHAVMEAVDLPSAPVQDVQVDGTSIVADGVANVPIASKNQAGAVKINYAQGINIQNGYLILNQATETHISNRSQNMPITSKQTDYAVRAAMCDGKGAAWTEAEQAAARERMGICDWRLYDTIKLTEDTTYLSISLLNIPKWDEIYIYSYFKGTGNSSKWKISVSCNSYSNYINWNDSVKTLSTTVNYYVYAKLEKLGNMLKTYAINPRDIGVYGESLQSKTVPYHVKAEGEITYNPIVFNDCDFPAGAEIEIWYR